MESFAWKKKVQSFDERRDLIIPGETKETIEFCVQQFLEIGQEAIRERGSFFVALSGGKTPNTIFKELSNPLYATQLDWTKVRCFWSDERCVPPSSPESNYGMAMQAGLANLPLPAENLIRMEGEKEVEESARNYEEKIREFVPGQIFDLLMLGMGEDGHTASLFPLTHGLHTKDRLVIANYIPQKNSWRLSLTYNCIHRARAICIYVLGKNKADTVAKVLEGPYDPDHLPIQRVGVPTHKALWILDQEAASKLIETFPK
jgi:6-phosphogluconolactonase